MRQKQLGGIDKNPLRLAAAELSPALRVQVGCKVGERGAWGRGRAWGRRGHSIETDIVNLLKDSELPSAGLGKMLKRQGKCSASGCLMPLTYWNLGNRQNGKR